MASVSLGSEQDINARLTSTILTLQDTIRSLTIDIINDEPVAVILPADSSDTEPISYLTSPSTTHPSLVPQLSALEASLNSAESSLRARHQWMPPSPIFSASRSSTTPPISPLPQPIDIADLTSAIHLVNSVIATSNQVHKATPRLMLEKYSWLWDPVEKEFFTILSPAPHAAPYTPPANPASVTVTEAPAPVLGETRLYLSRWLLTPSPSSSSTLDRWVHKSVAHTTLQPHEAAESLGAWEDWTWDEMWEEWCLELGEEEGWRCALWGSRWRVGEGGMEYVGRGVGGILGANYE